MSNDLSNAFGYGKFIEKGAPAKVGETRNWGGVQYTKQADGGWKPKAELNSSPENAPVPRGKPMGELHDFKHGMTHTVDFGDVHGEHDVHVHYNYDHGADQQDVDEGIAQSRGEGAQIDGKPIVINRHGEDVTHLVSPKEMESLHNRIDEHAGGPDTNEDDGGAEDAWDAEREMRDEEAREREAEGAGDDEVEASLTKALTFFQFVEKGKAAKPGESRNWGGVDYIKQPDGSWKPKAAAGKAPKAGLRGKKIDPADLHPTFMEHKLNLGKKGKHDVRLHYDINPGERPDTQSPGYEPFVEDLKIVNHRGEDIGHHVSETERKKLEGHVLQHWAGEKAEQTTGERRSILDLKIPVEEITTGPSSEAGTPEVAGTPASEFKSLESVISYKNFTEKGKAARPGETRNRGGTDNTKQPDGTWKPKGAAPHAQGVAFGPHSTSGPTPRGKPADTSGWDGSMDDTLDFNWGKGDANEHDVTIHYVLHREEGAGQHYPGAPAYAEVMVVNEHGEDVTDHIPESQVEALENRVTQHVARKYER